jgi:uncharacterized protein (DUF983 family)
MNRLRLFLRALGLCCPHCGARWNRAGVIDLAPRCDGCGFRLDRGETDAFLGSYVLSLFGALVLAAGLALASATVLRGLPRVALYAIALLAITAFALWFHPFGRLLWVATDLQFRPVRAQDFAGHAEVKKP